MDGLLDGQSDAAPTDSPQEHLTDAAAPARNRLLADATLIEALVRIDEVEVAARAIEEQRADLVTFAIDLREAVAEAVRNRDAAPSAAEDDETPTDS